MLMSRSKVNDSSFSKDIRILNFKVILIMSAIIVIALVGSAIPSRIMVTATPSLSYRVFYINPVMHDEKLSIRKDDYVVVKTSSPLINEGRPFDMTKRVACISGERLRTIGNKYYCDDVFLGEARERSLKGESLPQFKFNGTIPPNKLFLMGDHRDSFDSRHLGFIEVKDINAIAYPLF